MDSNIFSNDPPVVGPMTFDQASNILGCCTRYELRDHAFSDREISWFRGEVEVAHGYFGGSSADVRILEEFDGGGSFTGEEAQKLASRGGNVVIDRNDTTGPDEYGGR